MFRCSSDKGVKEVHAKVGSKNGSAQQNCAGDELPAELDEPLRWRLLRRVRMNTARSKDTLIVFELQGLHHVNRREPAAYDQGFVRSLVSLAARPMRYSYLRQSYEG